VIFNMMFPRWLHDSRAGAPRTAFHVAERTNLVAIAKASPDRLGTYAQERGWRNLRLLSSRNNTFNRDYHVETPDGVQRAVIHMVTRDNDGIRRYWTSEMRFKRPGLVNLRHLDLTLEGSGDIASLLSPTCGINLEFRQGAHMRPMWP
jgi:predicted dithiol-disulfide oxidoreductase (DUF899 family)